MKDILSEIVANKRFEIDLQQRAIDEDVMKDHLAVLQPCHSLREALQTSSTGIIAEFKRRSPSKGWIKQNARPEDIVPAYEQAGATALSILTDEKFFGGSLADIKAVRQQVKIPILRKDFIVDEYQLYQSKMIGADAILLIAAALQPEVCSQLLQKAHELKMEVLLEIHDESELGYITPDVDVVGVNNRHLGSFFTDVQNSFRLAEQMPQGTLCISESGISETDTVRRLQQIGYKGFLIGETFMKCENPAEKLGQYIQNLKK